MERQDDFGPTGSDYRIIVTRRRTSRMAMRIDKDGNVRVSVPIGTYEIDVEEFISKNRDWIERARAKVTKNQEQRAAFFGQLPLKTQAQWLEARDRLDAIVRPLISHYEPLMGVHAENIFYRATISRWGICYIQQRTVGFSLYLLLLPTWCIEQTVVHELAHLLVPNHGPRFYAVMDRYYPRWREAKDETRRIYRMEDED